VLLHLSDEAVAVHLDFDGVEQGRQFLRREL
jgi:hypothetical protein